MSDDKKDYLALIQEPIDRLSTASSVFKGFSATIVTGTVALSNAEIKTIVIFILFLPILAFAALDIYYLRIEKAYRGLYNDVLKELHPIDFSLTIPKDTEFQQRAEMSVIDCMKSPSIWLFYPVMFLILGVICFFKVKGAI